MQSEGDAVNDLPSYRVRESGRAKYVSLKLSLHDGLVVVVPSGFDLGKVPAVLRRRKPWLDRNIRKVDEQRRMLGEASWGLPDSIHFRAIAEDWNVEYCSSQSARPVEKQDGRKQLVLRLKKEDFPMILTALRGFLMRKARKHLPELLREVASENGFDVGIISVRLQKTRWGSCSKQANISLNAKLLFLPRDLMDYVLMHELCHTVYHNHSRDFWFLMEKHLPKALEYRRAIRDDSWKFVPPWLERGIERLDEQRYFYQ
jgi:predicted metal-dependent hydrolase